MRVKAIAALGLASCAWRVGALASSAQPEPVRFAFDPEHFVDPTTSANDHVPLLPGMQWVRAGTTEEGGGRFLIR